MEYGYYETDNTELAMQIRELRGLVVETLQLLKTMQKAQNEFLGFYSLNLLNQTSNSGGDIGGESIGGIRGKREGGNKGGQKTQKNTTISEPIEHTDAWQIMEQAGALLSVYLNHVELERMQSKRAKEQAADVMRKLLQQGYTKQHILQAVTDANNSEFWRRQFRSLLKLTRKNADGVPYIDVFLALNQNAHKLPTKRARIIV